MKSRVRIPLLRCWSGDGTPALVKFEETTVEDGKTFRVNGRRSTDLFNQRILYGAVASDGTMDQQVHYPEGTALGKKASKHQFACLLEHWLDLRKLGHTSIIIDSVCCDRAILGPITRYLFAHTNLLCYNHLIIVSSYRVLVGSTHLRHGKYSIDIRCT